MKKIKKKKKRGYIRLYEEPTIIGEFYQGKVVTPRGPIVPMSKKQKNQLAVDLFKDRLKEKKVKKRSKKKKWIFVFGSNLAGRHGKGSALKARLRYGAKTGYGKGRTGSSYAIPTKDESLKVLPLKRIRRFINKFFHYAYKYPNLYFRVVKIGCGLAGYKEEQIKPMFHYFRYLKNVRLPKDWRKKIK